MLNKNILSFAILCCLSTSALASTGQVNGFLTIGGAVSDKTVIYGDGGTMKDGVDVVGESRIGVQADVKLNNNFSITAQAVAKGKESERDVVGVTGEWLFGAYSFDNSTKLRFGQLRLPLFMNSEVLDAGKAYTYAKLPIEMYAMAPTNSYQGIDLLKSFEVGEDGEVIVQPYAGISRFSGRNTVSQDLLNLSPSMQSIYKAGQQSYNTFEADSIKGVNVIYSGFDNKLKLRAGYMETNLSDKGGMTLSMSQMFGQGFSAENVNANFKSLGAEYNMNGFVLSGEYGERRVASNAFPDTNAYYVSLSKKLGSITPYISYSSIDSDKNKSVKGDLANNVLQQNTTALGVVYDINSNSNVKFEISQINVGKDNNSNYLVADKVGNPLNGVNFNTYRLNYNLLF